MQAIELEAPITRGEIHLRLPGDITADKARVIVLFENTPAAEPPSRQGLLQFMEELVANRTWDSKTKAEIDHRLDEERASWE